MIQKPYAIALLPRFVEVTDCWGAICAFLIVKGCGYMCFNMAFVLQIRSLRDPYPLIQTIVLRNVRHLCQSNNSVILALDDSIHGLFPVPLGAQVLQIVLNDRHI